MRTLPDRRKTSFVIDHAKAAQVQELLGARSLAQTIDQAFDEIIGIHMRQRFIDILCSGTLDFSEEGMASAWK